MDFPMEKSKLFSNRIGINIDLNMTLAVSAKRLSLIQIEQCSGRRSSKKLTLAAALSEAVAVAGDEAGVVSLAATAHFKISENQHVRARPLNKRYGPLDADVSPHVGLSYQRMIMHGH